VSIIFKLTRLTKLSKINTVELAYCGLAQANCSAL
jgi:hypothetical protein